MRNFKCWYIFLLSVSCVAVLNGCTQDADSVTPVEENIGEVQFGASVLEGTAQTVETRATEEGELIELDRDSHWDYFYIYCKTSDVGSYSKFGTYDVPAGTKAQLEYIKLTDSTEDGKTNNQTTYDKMYKGAEKLNWQSTDGKHSFISWNTPRRGDKSGDYVVEMADDHKTGIVYFGADNYAWYRLKYLIGTRVDPAVSYKENGSAVKMIYKYLVTKVKFENITRITSDGSVQILYDNKDRADQLYKIEFPDMPRTGTLHTGIEDDKFPYVSVDNYDNQNSKGVYMDGTDIADGNSFYLPPFKFKEWGKFVVTLKEGSSDGGYELHTYYGDLGDLVGNKVFGDDSDRDGIKAGECLRINLRLADGKVTGMSAYIKDWDEVSAGDLTQQVKPGIYTNNDFFEIWDAYSSSKDAFDMTVWNKYKCPDSGCNNVIHLYNNLKFKNDRGDTYTIKIPEGYTLDGLGHNIISDAKVEFDTSTTGSAVKDLYINGVYMASQTSGTSSTE